MAAAAPLLVGTAAAAGPLATGATLASTAAGAATTGLFGAGGSFGIFQALSTLSSVLPIFSAFGANAQESASAKLSAQSAEIEALQLESQAEFEKTRALQEQANRRQKLNEILNRQLSLTAGRGISIGSGSDLAISSFSEQEFDEESDIARTDSEFRQRQLRLQAQQARLGGSASLMSARNNASSRTFGAFTSAFERINTTK